MEPHDRRAVEQRKRDSVTVEVLQTLSDTIREFGERLRKLEDAFLVMSTRSSVHWSIFAAGWTIIGGIVVAIVGGAILWTIKK